MPVCWTDLPDDVQLLITRESMRRAAHLIARQAEALAEEFEVGALEDRGGADALHLFAALVRELNGDDAAAGHA